MKICLITFTVNTILQIPILIIATVIIIISLRKKSFFEDDEVIPHPNIPTGPTTDLPISESIFHRIEEDFPDNDDDSNDDDDGVAEENYQTETTAEENISNTCRSKYLIIFNNL